MHRVVRQIAISAAAALSLVAFAACNTGKAGPGAAGDAAATVNGKPITLKQVDQVINLQAAGQQAGWSPLQLANARMQALQGLVESEVLFQRAEKENLLPKEDEITQAISQRKQQARMTEEEWQKALREGGETEESLRDKARRDLAIQKLLEKTAGTISIRDNEVEEFYNGNKERFVSQRGVFLSAIIVDQLDSGGALQDDAKNETEAKAKIEGIYAQLKTGTVDFASLARAKSEDQSAANGGDLGFFSEEQLRQQRMPQEVVASLFNSMQPGGFTAPIRLEDGRFYIFKLTNRRLQSENQTLDTPGVRDQIKDMLIGARRQILGDALRVVAISEAKVVNNLASSMLNDPNMLGGLKPVQGAASQTPAAAASSPAAATTPAQSPAANTAATAAPSPKR